MTTPPDPIDWSSNEFRRAVELAAVLVRRDGKRISPSVVAQWAATSRHGVILASIKQHGELFVRPRALRRFVEQRAAIGKPVL